MSAPILRREMAVLLIPDDGATWTELPMDATVFMKYSVGFSASILRN